MLVRTKKCTWKTVQHKLAHDGFATFDPSLFEDDDRDLVEARHLFRASCDFLPPDIYGKGRYRRFGQYIFHTRRDELEFVAPVWDSERREHISVYRQNSCFNPEHEGTGRAFASLTDAQSSNTFLHSLIRRCYFSLPWLGPDEVLVGIHIIEFRVERNETVYSSPSSIHCDGEPYTWGFLMNRVGVIGAENLIANVSACGKTPEEISSEDILCRITLESPFQGWVVDDAKVSHYVGPVTTAAESNSGRRTILIVDFTPQTDIEVSQ